MGLSIGSSVGELKYPGGTETYTQRGRSRQFLGQPPSDTKDASPLFTRDRLEPDKVGFGAGTVSVPGIAVKAIGYNRRGATQIVETLQEAQDRIRERNAGLRAEESEQTQAPPPVSYDFRSAGIGAAQGARSLINGLNEAAGRAQSRVEGTPPPTNEPQINIQVGDQTIQFTRQAQQPTFDVFA